MPPSDATVVMTTSIARDASGTNQQEERPTQAATFCFNPFFFLFKEMKEKLTGNFYEQTPKMAKKTLTGPGPEPETSGLKYQCSSHLSYPAVWMVAVPYSQLFFAGVGGSFICLNTIV